MKNGGLSVNEWLLLILSFIVFTPLGWLLLFGVHDSVSKKARRNRNKSENHANSEISLHNKKNGESAGSETIINTELEYRSGSEIVEVEYEKIEFYKQQSIREIQALRERARQDHERGRKEISNYEKDALLKLKKIAEQKAVGFPFLAHAYADFFMLEEMKLAKALVDKKHPARSAAEEVKILALQKRSLQFKSKLLQYQLNYYESLFPWLTEFKNEEIEEELIRIENSKTQNTDQDGAYLWLTDGEYKNLPAREKYQLALERYRNRKKTSFEIGRDYERYIGWTYERDGYAVYYQGIIKGFDDLGRDLIVTKGNEVKVIQCKYWASKKTIHEKHIFQLYGTKTSYQIENPDHKVLGHFVTSTSLSDRAKKFADHLGLKISESTPLEEYPCIKCNISGKDGDRIYHLPFDQQYDSTKIEPEKGEFFCRTIAEAEERGFRRAMRHMVNIKSNNSVLY
jgi:hypothetical protein